LVVDEVLAVGDAEFQKKAIGKMQDISSGGGRTVLFVSHNMASVKSLCTRAIVLENGTTVFNGEVDEAVSFYLQLGNEKGAEYLRYFVSKEFDGLNFEIKSFGVKAKGKDFGEPIIRDEEIILETKLINHSQDNLKIVYRFKDENGAFIFVSSTQNEVPVLQHENTIHMKIPESFFNQGNFFVDILISNGKKVLYRNIDVINYTVIQESTDLGNWMGKTVGPLKPSFSWEYECSK